MSLSFTIHCGNEKIWNLVELVEFLNQNQGQSILLKINPEAISLDKISLYKLLDQFKFKHVQIKTCNPLEKHNFYDIVYNPVNRFAQEIYDSMSQYWEWTGLKTFLAFYARPTANRLGIAAYLHEYYENKTHLHFSCRPTLDNLDLFELEKLLIYDIDSIERTGRLIKKMPLMLHDSAGYSLVKYNHKDIVNSMYQDALIDIVSESHVLGKTFFPTEKTFRPMWCKRPFIVFSSPNYLDYLHQMGFRTFSDFWNEDYDGYSGRDRYLKMLELIDQLASKTQDDLEKMYWDMQYTLDYNYNLLLTQSYNKKITSL